MKHSAFLLIYLLSPEICRQVLGFRSGQIVTVPGNSARTFGGLHIRLVDNKKALMTVLPGYGEWEGEKGFWTTSAISPKELRYRTARDRGRAVYSFESSPREGVFLTLRPGIAFPIRKTIHFLDYRNGLVSRRSDLGSFFSMVSVQVQWPKNLSELFSPATRVIGCGYASSTVTVRAIVKRNAFDYVQGTVLSGDMREVRHQNVLDE